MQILKTKKRTRMQVSIAVLMALIAGVPLAANARRSGPKRLVVDCGSPRASIARAIQRAREGDTVEVRGVCTETVTVDKRITLDGRGSGSIVPLNPSDRTITVMARGVTIRGLTLEAPAAFQIAAFGGASVSAESNTIRNATNFGVSASTNSFVLLLGNTIADNANGVIALGGSTIRLGVRFFSDSPTPNVIVDNGGNGVTVVSNGTAAILGGNTISGNNIGVAVVDGGQARIAGTLLNGNQIGIFLNTNGTVQLPLASSPNVLFRELNSGVNVQLGIACRGGSITGVPDGLAPALRLAPEPGANGVLGGPRPELASLCFDQTESLP